MVGLRDLEKNQVAVYAVVLLVAAGVGLIWPDAVRHLDAIIPIVLGILMFGMFTQIPFFRLKESLSNRRYLYALCIYATWPW